MELGTACLCFHNLNDQLASLCLSVVMSGGQAWKVMGMALQPTCSSGLGYCRIFEGVRDLEKRGQQSTLYVQWLETSYQQTQAEKVSNVCHAVPSSRFLKVHGVDVIA